MLLMLSVRPERESDLLTEHRIQLSNEIPSRDYRDLFGNVCTRLAAPAGLLEIRNEFVISDNGLPDEVSPRAEQWPIDSLPDEVLVYLLGSRYCDTEKLSQLAWQQFGSIVGGWQRRPSVTMCMANLNSATITRDQIAPRRKVIRKGAVCVETSRIWA
jgi:hypothetical protein